MVERQRRRGWERALKGLVETKARARSSSWLALESYLPIARVTAAGGSGASWSGGRALEAGEMK